MIFVMMTKKWMDAGIGKRGRNFAGERELLFPFNSRSVIFPRHHGNHTHPARKGATLSRTGASVLQ